MHVLLVAAIGKGVVSADAGDGAVDFERVGGSGRADFGVAALSSLS